MVDGLVTINHNTSYNGVTFLTSFWLHLAGLIRLGKLASTLDKQRRKKAPLSSLSNKINFGTNLMEKNGISSPRIRLA